MKWKDSFIDKIYNMKLTTEMPIILSEIHISYLTDDVSCVHTYCYIM